MLWTKEEMKILTENYAKSTPNELEKLLPNKDRKQIKRKAGNMKLKKNADYEITFSKVWSEKESELLRKHYANTTMEDLLKLLPLKNKNQITGRASYEGLKKSEEQLKESFNFWTDEEVVKLKRFYEISTNEEMLEKIPNKTTQQICYKANSLGLKKDENYLANYRAKKMMEGRTNIWSDEEIAILKKHYEEGGVDECSKLLEKRTEAQIYVKASNLGLKTKKVMEDWKRIKHYPNPENPQSSYTFEYIKKKGFVN